ncbi:MAG: hypothetical protein GVY28_00420 [Alphaproteobacteria bacterium]|jgi:hypothetical protein|nr:hypothetical protein [Alphaproteobacteria bacterium]
MDLRYLTVNQFTGLVGDTFRFRIQGHELPMKLVKVAPGYELPIPRQLSFGLLFKGPPQPILENATYDITHHRLGVMPMMLVTPVAPLPNDPTEAGPGMLYQVVFA